MYSLFFVYDIIGFFYVNIAQKATRKPKMKCTISFVIHVMAVSCLTNEVHTQYFPWTPPGTADPEMMCPDKCLSSMSKIRKKLYRYYVETCLNFSCITTMAIHHPRLFGHATATFLTLYCRYEYTRPYMINRIWSLKQL